MPTKTFDVLQPSRVTVTIPEPTITESIVPIAVPPTNQKPTARAGSDQTVTIPANATLASVVLDASGSTDPENKPLTFFWRQLSGPTAAIQSNVSARTNVTLAEGTSSFEVRAVDPEGLFGVDTVTVVAKKEVVPVNVPPIARAGADQTVLLPLSEINLDGSLSIDPDGQIASYLWSIRGGNQGIVMSDPTKPVVRLSNLQEGIFEVLLVVTDQQGATSSDTTIITVKKENTTPLPTKTFPFSVTKNTAFKRRNFSGFENWNGQNYANFGGYNDYYFRFVVTDFLRGENLTPNFTRFDQEFRKAIAVGGKFSFRVFMVNDSDNFLAIEKFPGSDAEARYPYSWQKQMMAESVKPFVRNGMHIPNWNSPSMLNNFAKLLKDIYAHIVAMGWEDKVNYTDIGEYGQWGEWHAVNIVDNVSQYPAGTRPTVASYKRFIDSHIEAFQDWPLVCLFAAYDANLLGHTMTPPEVTYYVLTARNRWGLIGWRRDQWGNGANTGDTYVNDYLENNNRSYNGVVFKTLIMERWKYAPVVGEPYGPGANLTDLPRQAAFYHMTSVGNGNFPNNSSAQALFKQAEDAAGYKLSILSGNLKTTADRDFDITASIENFGNGVCHEKYTLVYQLKNSLGQVVWSNTSPWEAKGKIKGTYAISDHFKLSVPIDPGTYSLSVQFQSEKNYRRMPLFNDNQAADGSLIVTSLIKIAA